MRYLRATTLAFSITVTPLAASAAVLSTTELLNQFNVITTGDFQTSQDIGGRAAVGGNATGGPRQIYSRGGAPASDYDALVVVGNVTGQTLTMQNGSNATVGGNVSNSVFELNGGGTLRAGGSITAIANQGTKIPNQAGTPGFADRFPEDVAQTLGATSASLSTLTGLAPTISGNRATFNAAPTGGTTIYAFDFGLLSTISEIDMALNGADTLIFNVTGAGGTLDDNFLGAPFSIAPRALWNFSEATQLNFTRQFFGSVLAPNALITSTTAIEGSVAAMSTALAGELHLQPFIGTIPAPIPLPATLPLIAAALAAFGLVRRRAA